jgi:preprotein translocase subunit SecE
MAKTNPFEFFQQVRAETSKVTWPSRRETLITTVMVFIFTAAAAIFFLIVDWVIRTGMSTLLSFLR